MLIDLWHVLPSAGLAAALLRRAGCLNSLKANRPLPCLSSGSSSRRTWMMKKRLQSGPLGAGTTRWGCIDLGWTRVCRRSCARSRFRRLRGTSTCRRSTGSVLPASCVRLLDSSACARESVGCSRWRPLMSCCRKNGTWQRGLLARGWPGRRSRDWLSKRSGEAGWEYWIMNDNPMMTVIHASLRTIIVGDSIIGHGSYQVFCFEMSDVPNMCFSKNFLVWSLWPLSQIRAHAPGSSELLGKTCVDWWGTCVGCIWCSSVSEEWAVVLSRNLNLILQTFLIPCSILRSD